MVSPYSYFDKTNRVNVSQYGVDQKAVDELATAKGYADISKEWAEKSEEYAGKSSTSAHQSSVSASSSKGYSESAEEAATEAKIVVEGVEVDANRAENAARDAEADATTAETQANIAVMKANEANTHATSSAASSSSAGVAATNAESSATQATKAAQEAQEALEEAKKVLASLTEGAIYRGVWSPKTGAYPNNFGTNSYWDVSFDGAEISYNWDGKTWYRGDRLVYALDENAYYHITFPTGSSGVITVNGKAGAVTLTAADVQALGINGAQLLNGVLTISSPSKQLVIRSGSKEWHHEVLPGQYNIVETGVAVRATYAPTYFDYSGEIRSNGQEVYSPNNKPTASDVGALPTTGGELTGALSVNRALEIKAPSGANPITTYVDVDGKKRGDTGWNRNSDRLRISKFNSSEEVQNYLELSDTATMSSKPLYTEGVPVYSELNRPYTYGTAEPTGGRNGDLYFQYS